MTGQVLEFEVAEKESGGGYFGGVRFSKFVLPSAGEAL